MNDRFRPQMIQSDLFASNTLGRCDFCLQLRTILQQCLLPDVTFIQTFDFLWVGVSWTQWRLVTLKVPEARTQCPTIIVFTTPVGFGERDTHLWASILQNFYPFRERSFSL